MNWIGIGRGIAAAALLIGVGCHSLDIQNPNAPDNKKLLSDPDALESVAAGSLRTWANAWSTNRADGPLTTMARTMSASWNNDHMRYYSSVDNAGDNGSSTDAYNPSATWYRKNEGYYANDPTRTERDVIEAFWTVSQDECCVGKDWPGFFAGMSSASDALGAIRGTLGTPLVIRNAADTKRAEIMAMLGRGLALNGIALNYDKGYIIDEKTDLTKLQYSNRKAMRDAAVATLQAVMDSAAKYNFTTDAKWFNGKTYTSDQIRRFAATMIAMTYAYYPRDYTEISQQQPDQVQKYARLGMGSSGGAPFDLVAVGDACSSWCPDHLVWFDEVGEGRISTRVAHLLDPVTQKDPFPLTGNPQPNSADKRLGDGTYGDGTLSGGSQTIKADAGAGTDFAYGPKAIYRPARGLYHQSNLTLMRYDLTKVEDASGIVGGNGPFPLMTATLSDLLLAEADLRLGGAANIAEAVGLINKTRVGRGGLPPAGGEALGSDTDGPCMSTGVSYKDGTACSLWAKLLYEKEIELLGIGPTPYYEQRKLPFISTCITVTNKIPMPGEITCNGLHVAGLLPGTPREMPVPAKELQVKGEPLYTFGGTLAAKSPAP